MNHKLTLTLMIVTAGAVMGASDLVKIDSGKLKGATADGVTYFKGIP